MNYNYSYEQTIYTSAYFNRIIDSELSKTPFYTKIIEDYKKVTKDPIRRYQDEQVKSHIQVFIGWTAQIIQHECDHLEGILI